MTEIDDDFLFDDSLSVSWKTTKYWPGVKNMDRILTRDDRGVVMLWEYNVVEDHWFSLGENSGDGSGSIVYYVPGTNSVFDNSGMEEWAALNSGFAGMAVEDILKEFAPSESMDRMFTETEISVGADGTTVEATRTYVNGKPQDTRYVYKTPKADNTPTKKERVFELLNKLVGR